MKRALSIVAILCGLALTAASPAQAGHQRGHHARPPVYTKFYRPYFYGPYGPPAHGFYRDPGSPGYGGYPGWPYGVGVW